MKGKKYSETSIITYCSCIDLYNRLYGNDTLNLTIRNIREYIEDAYTRKYAILVWLRYNRLFKIEEEVKKLQGAEASKLRPKKFVNVEVFKGFLNEIALEAPDLALILRLMYDSAARVAAILNLKVGDLGYNEQKKPIISLKEKGGTFPNRSINPETEAMLKSYISSNGLKGKNGVYIFRLAPESREETDYQNFKRTYNHYYNILRMKSEKYGITQPVRPISFHWLRSDRAKRAYSLYKNDLVKVKNLLGHININTTMRYIDSGEEASQELIDLEIKKEGKKRW